MIDVGSNVGCYVARLSALVGPDGRVISFEPVPVTFELLAATTTRLPHRNVTLPNAAASEAMTALNMTIPRFDTGLDNYNGPTVTADIADLRVLSHSVGSFGIPNRVSLVKIDAERHDLRILRGMRELLRRDRPVLIVDGDEPELVAFLADLGNTGRRLDGSSDEVYEASADGMRQPDS